MVNKTTKSVSNSQKHRKTTRGAVRRTLKSKISHSALEIQAKKGKSVETKVQQHWENLEPLFSKVKSVISRRESLSAEKNVNRLSSRIQSPLHKYKSKADTNSINKKDFLMAKSINIPSMEKIPTYISWVCVNRNEKMAEDQSTIGKEQMYYDNNRGEMVICSDSEEEMVNAEDVKHIFTEDEDQLLWTMLQEYGSNERVLSAIKEYVKTTDSQIQERFEKLKENNMGSLCKPSEDCQCKACESRLGICLEKNMDANLDSLDNLFCRQCLVFNCSTHGTSQLLIYPDETELDWSKEEGERQPCSDQCGLLLKDDHGDRVEGQIDFSLSNSKELHAKEITTSNLDWKPLERDLYLQGVNLFGKNSCLIARNLLPGLKTCSEVAKYMSEEESLLHGSIPLSITNNDQINAENMDQETPSRSQLLRKKGKAKKLYYSQKSMALPAKWRRIAYGQKECYKQYTPCRCHGICTNECPCHRNDTRCEKYCGCSRFCNNRFKGCYCVKGECRTKQCPCFATNRECDPDVCRTCWISCGDGSLGEELPRSGDGSCGNMNLLLGKKERVILGESNVVGWGVFAKNPIDKNVCLGEYTGELITHKEAEKRGKLYNLINHSFLFTLNDQWVIDARRFGVKLKFANHSSKPNCYAKIMFVKGDHRVGIFAKENIKADEEIFYDYFFREEFAPLWARSDVGETSKKSRGKQRKSSLVYQSKEGRNKRKHLS